MPRSRSPRPALRAALLAAAVCTLAAGSARAGLIDDIVPWDTGFLLQTSGGIENPVVLVGFNPQPEPPARITELDLTHPPEPGLVIPGQSTGQLFELFVALSVRGQSLSFSSLDLPATDFGSLGLQVVGDTGATLFDVIFDFSTVNEDGTQGGGIASAASAVSFNPQPEPPAFGAGAAAFGMNFTFTSLSDAVTTLRVLDAQGNALTFSAVPEPAALALAVIGLAAVGGRRLRRR